MSLVIIARCSCRSLRSRPAAAACRAAPPAAAAATVGARSATLVADGREAVAVRHARPATSAARACRGRSRRPYASSRCASASAGRPASCSTRRRRRAATCKAGTRRRAVREVVRGPRRCAEGRYAIEAHVDARTACAGDARPTALRGEAGREAASRSSVVARVRADAIDRPRRPLRHRPRARRRGTRDEVDGAPPACWIAHAVADGSPLGDASAPARRVAAGRRRLRDDGGPRGRALGRARTRPVAAAYAAALDALPHGGRRTGRLELLDVPFADPDLAGPALDRRARRPRRAITHRGARSTRRRSARRPSAGTRRPRATASPCVAAPVLELAARPARAAAVRPRSVASRAADAGAGRVRAARQRACARSCSTSRTSALLDDPAARRRTQLLDHAVRASHLGATRTARRRPVQLGPGPRTDVAALEPRSASSRATGWIRFVDDREAAAHASRWRRRRLQPTALPRAARAARATGTRSTEARRYAGAFVGAVSERDADADGALVRRARRGEPLLGGRRTTTGGSPTAAARSPTAAMRPVARRCSTKVSVSSADDHPVGQRRARSRCPSGTTPARRCTVDVVASSPERDVPLRRPRYDVTLRPADNYVTVPVDLGTRQRVRDRLGLSVVSGGITLASTTVDVRASYLDRHRARRDGRPRARRAARLHPP